MDDAVLRGLARCALAGRLSQAQAVDQISEFYSVPRSLVASVVAEVFTHDADTNLALIQAATQEVAPHVKDLGEETTLLVFLKGLGSQ